MFYLLQTNLYRNLFYCPGVPDMDLIFVYFCTGVRTKQNWHIYNISQYQRNDLHTKVTKW